MTEAEEPSPQQIQQTFQQIEKECSVLINKIAELEQEVNEHNLVLKAFEKVEPTRRCFRMIGGVLVERTVNEVKPAIEANKEKIGQATEQLNQQLKKKTEQRKEFQQKYGLNTPGNARSEPASSGAKNSDGSRAGGGSVLV
mmetsp:Transcript_22973/g.36704  ORF Transcript_22973/g.36704 Transcript_22973/m.36704 type:complete len:141 (+) Transcript_22973:60-482(+)|eukprot:CAMPEP_0169113452 /NCGR_PEP_ID=MMETSP1015-20121227/28216_1 /TAXON_ID=342587 /ORGANISM="Karlodinium micrum, Strain CCMP2283" /LENGTH=140 /DNA_ID=CAMNT_0009175637 /DNA_START=49 /DNA_END=471 /DNA_ORIENTATION=-